MKKLKEFFQKEAVLCIAVLLAVISAFVVLPDREYIDYIDFHTLALLFCLMCVMAGLQKLGVFQMIAEKLLGMVRGMGQLVTILVLLCFFFSMLITNDVALITFVPFTFTVLKLLGEEYKAKLGVPIVVLQTIGANMGSMMTPIGNPQNLYLYGKSGISLGDFLLLMLPYTAVSLILLLICCLVLGKRFGASGKAEGGLQVRFSENTAMAGKTRALTLYLILFGLCLLTVAQVLSIWMVLVIVLLTVLVLDRRVLMDVDYSLLLTFIGFFVFIGNMGRIPAFYNFLKGIVRGNEVLTAVISSQAISNVPAALLLSSFTDNYRSLIVGINMGGLGTLIASMASLISYKLVAKEDEGRLKGKYLMSFTGLGIVFLVVLAVTYIIIGV